MPSPHQSAPGARYRSGIAFAQINCEISSRVIYRSFLRCANEHPIILQLSGSSASSPDCIGGCYHLLDREPMWIILRGDPRAESSLIEVNLVNKCRNCGASEIEELGPIGKVAPFFLKRVLGLELRHPTTPIRWKQAVREGVSVPVSLLSRFTSQFAYVEMQICSSCSFFQTKIPFHDEDIMRLYRDYRSSSYNAERIKYEPSYAAIAESVGQDQVEIKNRTSMLTTFLRRHLTAEPRTLLDYGGSDGRFIPDIAVSKNVFEVSDIEPVAGVTRLNSEKDLGSYSLVLLAHVVEHVPYPLDLVQKVASYVEADGYLYIETPQEITDDDRIGLKNGTIRFDIGIHEHINSYCMSAVSRLLEAADLHLVAIESTPVNVGWAKATHIRALGRKAPKS